MSDSLASLVGDFQITEHSITLGPAVPTQVLTPNPTRWAALFQVGQTGTSWNVTTIAPGSASTGAFLSSTFPILAINFRDYGALVNLAWFGFSNAGAPITVTEVLYRPSGPTIGLDDLAKELATLRRQAASIPDHYHRQLSELRQHLSSRPHTAARK